MLTLSVTKVCNKGDYLFSVFNGFGRFSCFWTLFVFKGLLSFLLLSNEKVTSSSPHVLHSLLCCDKYIPENIVWLWRPPTTKSDLTNMPYGWKIKQPNQMAPSILNLLFVYNNTCAKWGERSLLFKTVPYHLGPWHDMMWPSGDNDDNDGQHLPTKVCNWPPLSYHIYVFVGKCYPPLITSQKCLQNFLQNIPRTIFDEFCILWMIWL